MTLTKQAAELRAELYAARVAAKAAASQAGAAVSLWRLPRLLANSTQVHELSTKWLEAQSVEAGAGGVRSVALAGALVATAALAILAVFLLFPRYLL